MALLLALTVLFGLVLYLSRDTVGNWIALLVENVYSAPPGSRSAQFFSLIAENRDSIPAEDYIRKGIALYDRLWFLLGWISFLLITILAYRVLAGAVEIKAGERQVSLPGLLGKVVLAGAFLGFSASIRVLGPAAGVLVGAYFWLKNGLKAILALPLYRHGHAGYLPDLAGLWEIRFRYFGFITLDFPFRENFLLVEYPATALPGYLPVCSPCSSWCADLVWAGSGLRPLSPGKEAWIEDCWL
jgi:hypothetical protein